MQSRCSTAWTSYPVCPAARSRRPISASRNARRSMISANASCFEMPRKASTPNCRSAISAARSAVASTTVNSPVGSTATCSMALGSTVSVRIGGRGSGSTRPISTTERRLCSERPLSMRCAAISGPIASPKRSRPQRRCRSHSRRSCWRRIRAGARRHCRPGSNAHAAIRMRSLC